MEEPGKTPNAQSSNRALFFRAYYLQHEEDRAGQALELYRRFLEAAPEDIFAFKAAKYARRILLERPDSELQEFMTQYRHYLPEIELTESALRANQPRRIPILDYEIRRALNHSKRLEVRFHQAGNFLEKARLQTQAEYFMNLWQIFGDVQQTQDRIDALEEKVKKYQDFGVVNDKHRKSLSHYYGKLADIDLVSNFWKRLSDAPFGFLLTDFEHQNTHQWLHGMDRFSPTMGYPKPGQSRIAYVRTWLAEQCSNPDVPPEVTAEAKEISHNLAEIERLLQNYELKEAQTIAESLWDWVMRDYPTHPRGKAIPSVAREPSPSYR
ncbi:MAG: hypothetical protein V3T77_03255 [Planctomycetota bacterium]